MGVTVPATARIVIIGGGIIGCSIAYHLAKRGVRDVVLLERLQLTHGATWHAAGLVGQLRSSSNLTRLMRYGAELYGDAGSRNRARRPAGIASGSLRLASSPARWQELQRSATMAKGFGFHVDLVSPTRGARPLPACSISTGVVGAAWIEGDGYVDPASLTSAYAAGARNGGASLLQRCPRDRRSERSAAASRPVVTDAGEIATECVIDAAGMWGGEIAAMVGTRVPACAVEHQYFVTGEDRTGFRLGLPSLRDPDGNFYLKPEPGAFAVGGWESNTRPWGANGIPRRFRPRAAAAGLRSLRAVGRSGGGAHPDRSANWVSGR